MSEKEIIKSVIKCDDYYSIQTEGGSGFGLDFKYGVEPKAGDVIEIDITNGSTIRGLKLNSKEVFYKTDEDLAREHKEWCENHKKQQQEEFEKEKDSLDAKYNALPKVFQKRIDKFRANNPNFRVEYESYEMFCCEQAVEIANAMQTKEAIKEFADLDWEKQKEKVPNLDGGHSGNTFAMSCRLAYWYLDNPENVVKEHGSLSVLVGSEEYGDVAKDSNEK
jgi:hypothetical protein